MNPARHIISEELCYLLVTLLTMGTQSAPFPTDVPVCTASETAHYQLTFTGKWSRSAFPKQYPVYRPPAQWSNIVGKSSARWFQCGVIGRVVRYGIGFWVLGTTGSVWSDENILWMLPMKDDKRNPCMTLTWEWYQCMFWHPKCWFPELLVKEGKDGQISVLGSSLRGLTVWLHYFIWK